MPTKLNRRDPCPHNRFFMTPVNEGDLPYVVNKSGPVCCVGSAACVEECPDFGGREQPDYIMCKAKLTNEERIKQRMEKLNV